MARKEKEVIIPHEEGNRDSGKVFLIKEMPASQGERWANRAGLAIGHSGADVPFVPGGGWAMLAILGFKALFGIQEKIALELADEMFQCVHVKPDRTNPNVVRPLNPDPDAEDIEEIKTRWLLRAEVFALHSGFSLAEVKSKLISAFKTANSGNTQTFQEPSGQSSAQDSPPSSS